MGQCAVVEQMLAYPLSTIVAHLVLLHMEHFEAFVDLEHDGKMLRYFIHPAGELVLRRWSTHIQRTQCLIVVENGGQSYQALYFL